MWKRDERGFAMVLAVIILMVIAVLSTGLVYSSMTHHVQSVQAADKARALALAEGAASLVLNDLSDDSRAPILSTSYDVDAAAKAYTRTFAPFEEGDGQVRINATYMVYDADAKVYNNLLFADRADPQEDWDRLKVEITGLRPRAERTVEIYLEKQFTLLTGGAIVSDALGGSTADWNKSLAQAGHVVFNDKGRPNQLWVAGNMMANGGIYYTSASGELTTDLANKFINFTGQIWQNLAGTGGELKDYTAVGSPDQLFDFGRFIEASKRGAGTTYKSISDFVTAMNAANAAGQFLEGIIVINSNPNTDIDQIEPYDIPGGINIRGTLLFNFSSNTDPMHKVFIKVPLNINPADLTNLKLDDPTTYTSGYEDPWADETKRPWAVDLKGSFKNFTDTDDFPALMFNTGIVDVHGSANISGLIYGPSFIELENKYGELQYFTGSIIGGAGIYIEGNSTAGNTVVQFNKSTIDRMAVKDDKGMGLRIISWRAR